MKRTIISTGFQPESTPYGKVTGIVKNQAGLDDIIEALDDLGVSEIEIIDGAAGKEHLRDERGPLLRYFMGDMEAATLQRYVAALEQGEVVFAAHVDARNAETVAQEAKRLGADAIAHFGDWVITNY